MRLPADLLLAGENDLPLRIAPLHPGVPHWQISLYQLPQKSCKAGKHKQPEVTNGILGTAKVSHVALQRRYWFATG